MNNGPKEHQQQPQTEHAGGEDTGFDSWRGGNSTHHSSYPIGTGDPYSPYYAGTSFPYQTFGAGDGTWSNGTDPVAFLSGYGGQIGHDAYGMDGMFSASAGGGFSTFGQPAFNYFHGNGDFSAWGTPRKTRYEDYYQAPRGNENYPTPSNAEIKTIEQSVQGLSLGSGEVPRQDQQTSSNQSIKPETKEPRKITWASVASQPAKPVPPLSSSQGMKKKAGMPPPPIVPGKHNMDIGTWGEGKSSAPPPTAPPPPQDDIHRSIKYEIWCSTEHGNKRLDQAYKEASREGAPLYLFFSVNGSGHFCGMAQMVSPVDYKSNSSVWSQDKWKGQFRVRWIYVKDVPNVQLRHIRLENNENKPVTNSRDAQEVPHAKGVTVLRILHTYRHSTSIFDDFGHYERKQAEEDQRKAPSNAIQHHHSSNHRNRGHSDLSRDHHPHQSHLHHQRKDRDGGRGRGRGGSRQ
ncbi:hypothetical protein E2986_02105 [Frieseomelitta varia]|uniref:YTH domain-containing protein n=1 Tax=Frieseomelitta varia TaxID=561572 RepID=A0A833VZB6_9HYME|nr:hypothetical protein E2986_02105 [Frieseomelitta varia]